MSTLIIGSKPSPQIPTREFRNIVYVNGSIGLQPSLSGPGCVNSLHVLSTMVLLDNGPLARNACSQLRDRSVDSVVLLDIYDKDASCFDDVLKRLGYQYRTMQLFPVVDFERRFKMFSETQYWRTFLFSILSRQFSSAHKLETLNYYRRGRKHFSSGYAAILYALGAGLEKPIYVSGLGTMLGGYHYHAQARRGHELQDFIVLRLLQRHGFLDDIRFMEDDVKRLISELDNES